jgi:hypothetical protein
MSKNQEVNETNEAVKNTDNSAGSGGLLGNLMLEISTNDIFRQSKNDSGSSVLPNIDLGILPVDVNQFVGKSVQSGIEDALKGLEEKATDGDVQPKAPSIWDEGSGKNPQSADQFLGSSQSIGEEITSTIKSGIDAVKSLPDLVDGIRQSVEQRNEEQEERAVEIAKDPGSLRVSVKGEGLDEKVVVEKRDGSTTTMQFDGTTETVDTNGVKTTIYPQGSDVVSKIESPDGRSLTTYPDGTTEWKGNNSDSDAWMIHRPDGTTVSQGKDGTTTHLYPDGASKVDRPDGSSVLSRADGSRQIREPNGDMVFEAKPDQVNLDGSVEWKRPDGTDIREDRDGTRTTTYPESVNPKVKSVIEHPNGEIERQSRDGLSTLIAKPDGSEVMIAMPPY